MHRISVLPPLLCFTYALAAGACGGGEAPPNPLALTEEEQPSATSQPTEGGDSGGAQGPEWVEVNSITLDKEGLDATVVTSAQCCGGAEIPYRGSPARFYLAPATPTGGDGYLLWLNAEGHTVLGHQSSPGSYDQLVYHSEKPAVRTTDKVTLSLPAEAIPATPFYIWAGTRNVSTVAGLELPISLDEGGIPAFRVKRKGDPAQQPAPSSQTPSSKAPAGQGQSGPGPGPEPGPGPGPEAPPMGEAAP